MISKDSNDEKNKRKNFTWFLTHSAAKYEVNASAISSSTKMIGLQLAQVNTAVCNISGFKFSSHLDFVGWRCNRWSSRENCHRSARPNENKFSEYVSRVVDDESL